MVKARSTGLREMRSRGGADNMKTCARCKFELSLDDFGLNKNRSDDRAPYCFSCNRAITNAHRAGKRAHKAARAEAVKRKPVVTAPQNFGQVERAIRDGYRDWRALIKRTRLDDEQLGLALVDLIFDKRSIRPRTINGERVYILRAA